MAVGMFLFSAVDALAKFLTDSLHPFQIVWIRQLGLVFGCLLYTSPSPRDATLSRMPSSA